MPKADSSLQTGTLAFYDPEGIPFTYTLVFYGRLNHAPRFTSVPVVQVVAGQTYRCTTTAADPDNDFLTFSVVSGPSGLAFTDAHAGTLTWSPSAAGNYSVRLRVSDNKGGTADQSFVLTVLPTGTNYPPVFTSTPAVHANVASLYSYQAAVSDLDNDSQTFALVSGPTGLTINPSTGLVQWTPGANQTGSQAVTLQDTDAGGLSVQQTFHIWVDQALDNDPPLFVTTAITSVPAGQFYVYPSQAVDDDHDAISYTLTAGPGSMVIDPVTGKVTWQTTAANAGQQVTVTIVASDGRGASATQTYTLTVNSGSGTPGALQGTVYNDLNDNGQRDWLITPGSQGGPVNLQQASVSQVPFAMDYDPSLNAMLVLTSNGTNSTLEQVEPDGTLLPYASLQGLAVFDGTQINVVRPGNTAGFTAGDVFVPGPFHTVGQQSAVLIKVTDGGSTVVNPWVTLPGNQTVGAVYVDQTGVFGDQLIAVTNANQVWLISASGSATELATGVGANQGEGGVLTVPNNPALYGPLAGQMLILGDGSAAVTVSPSGVLGYPHGPVTGYRNGRPLYASTGLDNAEGAALMPAGATNFFAIADTQSYIGVADASALAPYAGQFVSTHEIGGTAFTRVWFDGTNLQTATVPLVNSSQNTLPWYEDAFAPIGINPVPNPPQEPGLPSWTVYLDSNNNGQLDTGEPSTTTDVNGRYAFYNLAAGNYTVAEVPQLGWTQTGPIPVPPGTYSVTLAGGQTIPGLDFGNQQDLTPPVPDPLTPPSSNPDPPPVFDSTAPTNASVIVGQPFSYPASAHDPDGGVPLVFDLPVHPNGMVVGAHTGLVVWQPTPDQAGTTANVLLRVTDTQGSVALQWFQITVAATNPPPAISSTPPGTAYTTLPYKYTVLAQDGDGDTLSYSLTAYPTGMTLTGNVVSWTPTSTGQYSATVQVSDGHGGTATQGWNITVLSPTLDHAPTISSTPRQNIALGQTYYYEIVASDPENDPLTYTLTTKPTGMTISGTVVSWTPTASQFGSNSVVLQVSDGRNGTPTQSWTIQVTASPTNHPPTMTSTPSLVGVVGRLYSYNATATDADGDAIGWQLLQAPAGMSVDPDRGTVRWTPQSWQTGNQTVILEAYDPYGAAVAQSFTILVYATNQPPVILSTPPLLAQWKRGYSYAIQATDPDGDGLSYALSDGHGGLALVGAHMTSSGLFTATAQLSGTLTVTVTVTDSAGLTATQVYPLNVVNSLINYPPVITSSPTMLAPTGTAYSYQVAVSDPDNDTHTFALNTTYTGSGPPTINSSGLVSWTTPVAGTYQFTVTVTDSGTGNLTATQTYTLQVGANGLPSITSQAPTTVTAGAPYRYDVQAGDSDGDALTYALSGTVPSGMTIDSYGRITWSPGTSAIGAHNGITVTVTDAYGATASQTFNVTVSADTTAPSVELQLHPNPDAINQQETILVFGSDDVGVASLAVTVNGTNLRLDSAGEAFYTPASAGNYTIVATAKDAAGNPKSTTQTLTVSNPAGTPPTITLTSPAPDANITAPTNLVGTVSDDHIGLSYTVSVLTFDGTPPRLIGSGSTGTQSSLSLNGITFDPTLLPNGDYTIEVKVTDTDDNLTTTLDRHVSVSANLKLGREQMSVTDLTLPVAGIPITISRTYDSLEADKQFDFGYGWRLSYGDAKLTVDLQPGAGVGWGAYPAFLYGTRVYVTMPGGQREGFTFQPYQAAADPFGIFLYWHPYFAPDPGVTDTLSAPDNMLSFDANTGAYYEDTGEGYETYNPADPTFGGTYTVTNPAGLGSTIDATTGKLVSMKARNGNTLTITANGITSNTGRAVVISRNPAGNIVAITDPRGNSVKYGYNVNGDLVAVFDRASDPGVGYIYDATHAHYLGGEVDSLGVQQLQVAFDTNGRISQTTDAKEGVLNVGYNLNTLTQTVTDPNLPAGQQTTTASFSARGDVTDAVDPTGAEVAVTYNNTQAAAMDLPDTVTQVERLPGGGTTDFTTDLSYDSQGDVTGTTNEQTGATTHITYGPFVAVATSSDALGNTVTNTFDKNGNLLTTTSAAGLITEYSYDDNNNLLSVTPIDPNFSFVIKGGSLPPAGSTFSYDSFGNLQTSTSPAGVTTGFNYDPNGNRTGSSFTWKSGTSQQVVTTGGVFDPNDRQTQSIDQYGHPGVTHFDVAGNVTETDDVLGNPTTSVFDAANQVIRTTTPDGLIADTVYDPEGRTSYTDDPHVSGQADVHGTHTIYDSDGRVIETDRLDNVVIQVSETNGVWSSQFISAGTILSTTTSQYNDLGQVTQSTDAANQTSYFQYDVAGNQTFVTDPLQETTQTLYDLARRTVGTVDALGHVTRYVLDPDGKTLRTIYADGAYSQTSYDDLGRQSSVTDEMGRTVQYQYNRYGQMTAVVQPAVIDPRTGQLAQPLTQYSYDIYGNLTQIEDANQHFTNFSFDPFGHQLSRTLPLGQTETSTFDDHGREATHTDFKGQPEVFGYDNLGRLDSKTFYAAGSNTAGETVVYHFDSWGHNDTVTDTIAGQDPRVTSYGFDLDNQVTSITTPEGSVNYAYDPATGFHTRTWTANSAITYTPDGLQRVAAVTVTMQNGVTLGTPLVADYYYTPVGSVDHVTYPNGTETDYGYNTLNELITVSNIVSGTGVLLSSYTYTLDQSGLRTGVSESELEADGSYSTVVKAWDYDALERLAREDVAVTGSVPYTSYTDTYVYDLVGNRLSKIEIQGDTTTVVTSDYNNNDELTSDSATVNGSSSYQSTYGYDDNGSQTSIVRTGTGPETDSYGYDLENRLSTADISRTESGQAVTLSTTYAYDDSGPRAQQVVTINGGPPTTTAYLVDPSNPTGYSQVLEEHSNGSGTPSMSYFLGLAVLGQNTGAGAASYLMPDGQGSTRLVTNVTGAVIAREVYDGYGNLLGVTVGVLNPPVTVILFNGQRFDVVLEQYYLRARYYEPSAGRFGSSDSFAGSTSNPLSLHKYVYTPDNPVNFRDYDGHDWSISTVLVTAGINAGISALLSGAYGYAKGWSWGKILTFSFTNAAIAFFGTLGIFGVASGFVLAGVPGATALTATALIVTPTILGLAVGNFVNAMQRGDATDKAFATVDLALALYGTFHVAASARSIPVREQAFAAATAERLAAIREGKTNGAVNAMLLNGDPWGDNPFTGRSWNAGGQDVPIDSRVLGVIDKLRQSCGEPRSLSGIVQAGQDPAGAWSAAVNMSTGQRMSACASCRRLMAELGINDANAPDYAPLYFLMTSMFPDDGLGK